MSLAYQSTPLPPKPGIPVSDWQRTPTTVQDEFLSLLKRVDTLEAQLNRDSSNSSRPPSTDSAAKKRERRKPTTERRKPGAKPGHPGHPQVLLEPTSIVSLFPEPCGCGHSEVTSLTTYHTHQVIELPVIRPAVTHWRLLAKVPSHFTIKGRVHSTESTTIESTSERSSNNHSWATLIRISWSTPSMSTACVWRFIVAHRSTLMT